MTLYALEDVDDAFRVTRSFLTPFDVRRWLKLALVVFFVGGVGTGANPVQYSASGDELPATGEWVPPDLGAEVWLLVAGVVALAVVIGVAFLLVGSVMEFVLIESLRTGEVAVRRYWRRRWRQGLGLFGFRLVVGLLVFGAVALLFAPVLLAASTGDLGGGALALFLLLLPAVVVLGVVAGLVDGFTTAFVVPIMVLEDTGVLAGWRRLWASIRAEWKQYLAYVVAQFVLTIAGGLVLGMVAVAAALVLLVPFGLLGLVGGVLFAVGASPIGIAVVVAAAVLFGLVLAIVLVVAQAPVVAFLRYYALLVLGDVDAALDLVPDQRRAARGEPAA